MKTGAKFGFSALVLAVSCAALWIYSIRTVDIPEDRTVFVVIFLAAVALGITAFIKRPGWLGGIAAGLAIFIGALLPFTIAVSPQQAAGPIAVGDSIPHFTSIDEFGKPFDSDTLNGHLVLVKFFRAHW